MQIETRVGVEWLLVHQALILNLAQAEMARLAARIAEIDGALADWKAANASDGHRPASDLMRLRGEAEKARAASEANWLAASEALEAAD